MNLDNDRPRMHQETYSASCWLCSSHFHHFRGSASRTDNWQWVKGTLEHGVFEIGPDQATVEVTAPLWCGLQLRSASPLPTRAETETWQEALRGFWDRKSYSENPATNWKAFSSVTVSNDGIYGKDAAYSWLSSSVRTDYVGECFRFFPFSQLMKPN